MIDKGVLSVISAVTDAVIIVDEKALIVAVNRASQKLFGYELSELEGQHLNILIPPANYHAHMDLFQNFIKNEQNFLSRNMRPMVHGVAKGGDLLNLKIAIQKIHYEGDDFYCAICHDYTEQTKYIEALELSQARLARAQQLAKLGHWVWHIQSGDLYWSDAIYDIFEQDPEKFAATYDNFLETIHPDDRDLVSKTVEDCVANKKPYTVIHRIICASGIKYVKEVGALVLDDTGEPYRMDGTVQDITESYTQTLEIQKLKTEAEKANIAKSQFLSVVSHELRTPINAIMGMSEMMTQEMLGTLPDKYKEFAADIHTSGQLLLSHVNNVVDYTAMELGNTPIHKLEINARNFIEMCVKQSVNMARNKGIELNVHVQKKPKYIYLDPVQTQQIVVNLLSNAIKFAPVQSVVDVTLTLSDGNILIKVIDQGVGFDEEEQEKLFRPFTQKYSGLARHYDGLGLGLPIVKNLIDFQGGELVIDSHVGQGTTMTVKLPNA